jgi:hypothetical protein
MPSPKPTVTQAFRYSAFGGQSRNLEPMAMARPLKRFTPPFADDDDDWDGLEEMPPTLAEETAAAPENHSTMLHEAYQQHNGLAFLTALEPSASMASGTCSKGCK